MFCTLEVSLFTRQNIHKVEESGENHGICSPSDNDITTPQVLNWLISFSPSRGVVCGAQNRRFGLVGPLSSCSLPHPWQVPGPCPSPGLAPPRHWPPLPPGSGLPGPTTGRVSPSGNESEKKVKKKEETGWSSSSLFILPWGCVVQCSPCRAAGWFHSLAPGSTLKDMRGETVHNYSVISSVMQFPAHRQLPERRHSARCQERQTRGAEAAQPPRGPESFLL